jgi:hypothetical protein
MAMVFPEVPYGGLEPAEGFRSEAGANFSFLLAIYMSSPINGFLTSLRKKNFFNFFLRYIKVPFCARQLSFMQHHLRRQDNQ